MVTRASKGGLFGRRFSGYGRSNQLRKESATTTVAVVGATGTAGSRVTARPKGRGVAVIEAARAHGVDLISGCGLAEALEGVDVVIDVSNPMPSDEYSDIADPLATASHNLVGACASQEVTDWWC